MKAPLAILGAAALAATAFGLQPAAQAGPAPARSCFYANQMHAYRADGESTVYAGSGPNRIYRINMAAPCRNLPEVNVSGQLVVDTASGVVCNAAGLTLTAISSGGVPERCFVESIQRLSPAEVADLPARLRP